MNRRGCLLGVLTLLLAAAPVARGASYTVNGTLPGGGDCNSIGSWDPVASTCTVPTLTLGAADQLRITAATFEVGALSSAGTIYDLDTLRVLDTFVNTGDVFLQVDPGLPFPRPPVFDLAPGCIGNNSGSIVIGGQATARNYGSLTNSGSIAGDGLRSEGTLDNVAGGAIDVQRLENLGTFSSSGAMNNTHQIVNHGLFELRSLHDIVGSIDNRGTLRFRAQVVVNSGVANQGRIEISTGSGVHLYFGLTNTASGVLEIDGTLRLIDGPLQNAGFVHVKGLIGYLEFGGLTHVTNDGTVLNEGAVGAQELRNHGRFFNHAV